jgi:hypothetical protein
VGGILCTVAVERRGENQRKSCGGGENENSSALIKKENIIFLIY